MAAAQDSTRIRAGWRPEQRTGELEVPAITPRPPATVRLAKPEPPEPPAPPAPRQPRQRPAPRRATAPSPAPSGLVRLELATLAVALVLPLVLWGDLIARLAANLRWQPGYLVVAGGPWVLMALGVACYVPVAVHRVREPSRRFAQRGPLHLHGWAVSLYLLGFVLATQVATVWRLHH